MRRKKLTDEKIERSHKKLRDIAEKTYWQRVKLDETLESLKSDKELWSAICAKFGLSEDCESSDLLC